MDSIIPAWPLNEFFVALLTSCFCNHAPTPFIPSQALEYVVSELKGIYSTQYLQSELKQFAEQLQHLTWPKDGLF